MFDFNTLSISVDGEVHSTTVPQEVLEAVAQQNREKVIWIISAVIIFTAVIYFSFFHKKLCKAIKERSAKRKQNKENASKAAELDRLHKIKEKNKRK